MAPGSFGGAGIGDANSPIREAIPVARKLCAAAFAATQLTTTDTPCTILEIQAYEGNTDPIVIGTTTGVLLGTKATGYTDRVGTVIMPGETKRIATVNANLWYISGNAADWVTTTIYK